LLFMGTDAGLNNTGFNDVIGIGSQAAEVNSGTHVNAVGSGAAYNNSGNYVDALGELAANLNAGDYVIALGYSAGSANAGDNVIGLGQNAANNNVVNNVLALGKDAGVLNALGVSTIISNQVLPTYANHAAALLVIVAPTATTGTYLYHNQATDSIGAVRIP